MASTSERLVLRDLSVPTRLVIASFLLSVGFGYFSALVQLHFQHATPGKLLPEPDDAVHAYHGLTGLSQFQRLLIADEGKQFTGSGTMRPAFTTRSAGWKRVIDQRAKDKGLDKATDAEEKRRILILAERELRSERDGERLAILDWIRTGIDQKSFEEDGYPLPASLEKHPITEQFIFKGPAGDLRVKIASIVEVRCARCHAEGRTQDAFPLTNYEEVHSYCQVETTGGGMSLKKLAQSTHVHLLGFSMLYGLTGLIFTFTSYPAWCRFILGPFTLLAQILDISCWWLGRFDPLFAKAIVVTGGAVGLGLFLQIVLSLFNMFGKTGKIVLIILFLAAGGAGVLILTKVVEPYLIREAMSATVVD